MLVMPPQFKDYLFEKFQGWEKTQPKKRSSFSAYARWLSDNSFQIEVIQQTLNTWINGKVPTEEKYILVLAEKLGDEIFDLFDFPRPNPYLQIAVKNWEFMSEEKQEKISRMIAEEAAKYEAKKNVDGVQKVSKRRKAGDH